MSALPPHARSVIFHRLKWIASSLLALVVVLVAWGWYKLCYTVEQRLDTASDRFKYGSIGSEQDQGIPYWIWMVLPRVFPEYLPGPGGYASLGIVWDANDSGTEMPVGFSRKRVGFDRVTFNCALCHSATYRTELTDSKQSEVSTTRVVAAGPASRFSAQAYLNFLGQCANDSRFNPDTLMAAIEYNVEMSLADRLLYRSVLIPATRKAIRKQVQAGQWMLERPVWGHGRIDPFNSVKFGMLRLPVDSTIGNSDMMPLWDLAQRKTGDGEYHMHWDGLNTDPVDTGLAGALGDGANRKSLPVDDITRLVKWCQGQNADGSVASDRPVPPKYPYPIDREKAEQGQALFSQHCASCHATGGEWANRVVPWSATESAKTISTDRNRLEMWNPVSLTDPHVPNNPLHPATRYNEFGDGYPWDLNTFVGTVGYVAVPLNGIWLRSPYLHNGSVPTLEDLLNPPFEPGKPEAVIDLVRPGLSSRLKQQFERIGSSDVPQGQAALELKELKVLVDGLLLKSRLLGKRPPMFYRGSDVLSRSQVGFVHDHRAATDRLPVPYITFIRGNGNGGHLYGTTLSPTEKSQLVEYLKTL